MGPAALPQPMVAGAILFIVVAMIAMMIKRKRSKPFFLCSWAVFFTTLPSPTPPKKKKRCMRQQVQILKGLIKGMCDGNGQVKVAREMR